MNKQEMLDKLNAVTIQLEYVDDVRPTENETRKAIGAFIIAVNQLRQVVQALVEAQQ